MKDSHHMLSLSSVCVQFTFTVVYFTGIHLFPAVQRSSGAYLSVLCICLFPGWHHHPALSFYQSPLLCVSSPTELLRHYCPKAPQTSRQASDALHAVQPEGKQEGKTPIHGVCFYCLSSHPLKNSQGF